jgi:hypothetical protein
MFILLLLVKLLLDRVPEGGVVVVGIHPCLRKAKASGSCAHAREIGTRGSVIRARATTHRARMRRDHCGKSARARARRLMTRPA